jgi:RNA polymerase sigma factor (sigma-70 family)
MSESRPSKRTGLVFPRLGGDSDERLARRAAEGDDRAFAAIFRRYNRDLYRYCLAIAGNPADAQDAVQNAMVKAMRSLPGEQREIKLKPWLYRVAHNEAVELLRQRRGGESLDPEAPAGDEGLAETVERRRRLRHLFADLGELPERQRGALVMRELAGLDFDQIGAALGTSAATARQTVYEARLGLREMEAGREMGCDAVTRAISDADGRTLRRRDVRAHLRFCSDCRAFGAGIEDRRHDLAALSPLPAAAAAALLKGALSSAAAGGGAAGAAGSGGAGGLAAGAVGGTGLAVKSAATLAVVAVIGAGAADRVGLVRIGDSGDGAPTRQAPPASPRRNPPLAADLSVPARGTAGRYPSAKATVHLRPGRVVEVKGGTVAVRRPPRPASAEGTANAPESSSGGAGAAPAHSAGQGSVNANSITPATSPAASHGKSGVAHAKGHGNGGGGNTGEAHGKSGQAKGHSGAPPESAGHHPSSESKPAGPPHETPASEQGRGKPQATARETTTPSSGGGAAEGAGGEGRP